MLPCGERPEVLRRDEPPLDVVARDSRRAFARCREREGEVRAGPSRNGAKAYSSNVAAGTRPRFHAHAAGGEPARESGTVTSAAKALLYDEETAPRIARVD